MSGEHTVCNNCHDDMCDGHFCEARCITDIREVIGDTKGKLMQDELVKKIKEDYELINKLKELSSNLRYSNEFIGKIVRSYLTNED